MISWYSASLASESKNAQAKKSALYFPVYQDTAQAGKAN
jgi:hypothetical protein